jgi:hypothetical protein
MHVDGAPPAKRAPRLPPAAPAPATTMSTSNSQLRRPTSRLPVPQNYLNFPNEPIDYDNKTLSTLICSRSPSSTLARTHSRSTEALLSNTAMTLKQQKINTEDDNPSNHRKNFEESIHGMTRSVRELWGGRYNETRRGRRGEGDRTKPDGEDEGKKTNSNGGAAITPPTPSGGNST